VREGINMNSLSLKDLYSKRLVQKDYLPGFGVFQRETLRFFSVPIQTIAGPLGNSVLFYAIFAITLGSRTDLSANLTLGHSFVAFLMPGLMMMEVVNGSFQNPVSSLMIAKWTGTIVDQIMAPITPFATWCAYVSGALVRAALVALASYFVGSLFAGEWNMASLPLALLALTLSVCFFASIGIVAGVLCRDFDQVSLIGTFVIQPLVFLSGVFFSFKTLPTELSFLPYFNPIFYLVNLMRQAVLGTGDVTVGLGIAASAGFALVSSFAAFWYLKNGKGLKH
jgi:ABC-2 type transport system permease protein